VVKDFIDQTKFHLSLALTRTISQLVASTLSARLLHPLQPFHVIQRLLKPRLKGGPGVAIAAICTHELHRRSDGGVVRPLDNPYRPHGWSRARDVGKKVAILRIWGGVCSPFGGRVCAIHPLLYASLAGPRVLALQLGRPTGVARVLGKMTIRRQPSSHSIEVSRFCFIKDGFTRLNAVQRQDLHGRCFRGWR